MTKPSGRRVLRKAAALTLSASMALGGVPAPALAQMANGAGIVAQADVATGMWGTCAWELSEGGTLTIHPGQAASQAEGADSPWISYAGDITKIVCAEENGQKVVLGESAANLFAEQYNLLELDLSGLDTSNVKDFSGMFRGCTQIETLPKPQGEGLDTSNATNMAHMFEKCASLTSIHIPELNTKRVTNTNSMFKNCSHLAVIDASRFDTEFVTDMGEMFSGCSSLTELDISGFNTSNVTNMENMFTLCYSLEDLDVSSFVTSKVTSMYGMFSGCTSLRELDISGFDTSNVANMAVMFRGCAKLTSLDVSNFNTSKVTNMYGMFNGTGVTSLNLSRWDTSKVTSMMGMFFDAERLADLNVAGWDTSAVVGASYMFHGCASLKSLNLSSWDTSAMEEHEQMFEGCASLQSIKVGSKYQIKDEGMFPDATAITDVWWSLGAQEWLPKSDIVANRSTVADTYTAFADEDHRIDVAGAKVTLDKDAYAWTGEEVKPTPEVELDGMVLREGTDYEVSCKNNVNVGKASLTITGKGTFKGSKDIIFNISYDSIFIDVNEHTAHVEDIIWLADNGISKGWKLADGSLEFRPNATVVRADMAAFLFRLAVKWGVVEEDWTPTIEQSKAFADVQFVTPHSREIRWLASEGISIGWPKQDSKKYEFRPYAQVARQDMAAFLFRLAKLAQKGGASDEWKASQASKTKFRDVDGAKAGNHHNEVWWLAETGVSKGWDMGDGTYEFRGMSGVKRADMAAFLHRMDGLE